MNSAPGVYGKLPDRGDFITLRLPTRFVSLWDRWLQSAMTASMEQLGDDWLERYRVSAPWRFQLSAGTCGPSAWAGVLIPSMDRIGRYFPLTLACPLPDDRVDLTLLSQRADWFDAAEQILVYALDDGFSMPEFERRLALLPPISDAQREHEERPGTLPRAWRIATERGGRVQNALALMSQRLLEAHYDAFSLWWTANTDLDSGCLVCQGMPSVRAYASFLDGHWARGNWQTVGQDSRPGPAWHQNIAAILESETPAGPASEPATHPPAAATSAPPDLSDSALWLNELHASHDDDEPDLSLTDDGRQSLMDILNDKRSRAAMPEFSGEPQPAPADDMTVDVPAQAAHGAFACAGASHIGLVREENQDGMLQKPDLGLWAVADGMGGHRDGALASRSVIEALADLLPADNLDDLAAAIHQRIGRIDQRLHEQAEVAGITGSTLAIFIADDQRGMCLWAGDSRIYRLRDGRLKQLTRDHSHVNGLLDSGEWTREQALAHPEAGMITRAVGSGHLTLEQVAFPMRDGDTFLLCSDGLYREIDEHEIASVLATPARVEARVRRLLGSSLARGGRDNISLIAVERHG